MASKKDMAALFGNVGKQIEESRALDIKEEQAEAEKKTAQTENNGEIKAEAEETEEKPKTEDQASAKEEKAEKKEAKAAENKKTKSQTVKAKEAPEEAPMQEKPRRGRPKSEDTIVKKRITLDLDEQAVDDVNKIIRILYDSKDKMSLTKVIEMSLRDFVKKHQKELDAYNSFRK